MTLTADDDPRRPCRIIGAVCDTLVHPLPSGYFRGGVVIAALTRAADAAFPAEPVACTAAHRAAVQAVADALTFERYGGDCTGDPDGRDARDVVTAANLLAREWLDALCAAHDRLIEATWAFDMVRARIPARILFPDRPDLHHHDEGAAQ